jgi:tRNA(fMet)-specific endonuclease VapC
MLDTNTVSHLIRAHPVVSRRVAAAAMSTLCVSAITAGELLFGLARRPEAKRLHLAVSEFLKRVEVAPWDAAAAASYGSLRAAMEGQGRSLGPLDMLIAAHAASLNAVLVTNDRAFGLAPGLATEDWSAATA